VNGGLGYSSLFRAHILGYGLGAWLAMVRNLMTTRWRPMTLKIEGGRGGERSTVRLIGSGRSELVPEIAHQLEPCGQGADHPLRSSEGRAGTG